jgi:hypothetical protein
MSGSDKTMAREIRPSFFSLLPSHDHLSSLRFIFGLITSYKLSHISYYIFAKLGPIFASHNAQQIDYDSLQIALLSLNGDATKTILSQSKADQAQDKQLFVTVQVC